MTTYDNVAHALSKLRHMYDQMVNGHVHPNQEGIARIANGLLSPAIKDLEREFRHLQHDKVKL